MLKLVEVLLQIRFQLNIGFKYTKAVMKRIHYVFNCHQEHFVTQIFIYMKLIKWLPIKKILLAGGISQKITMYIGTDC